MFNLDQLSQIIDRPAQKTQGAARPDSGEGMAGSFNGGYSLSLFPGKGKIVIPGCGSSQR